MPKPLKVFLITVIGVIILIITAILIAPLVISLESYKPKIEKQVSQITGRPFELRGKLQPSVFPWVGVALSDLHMGNPSDFDQKDFVSVQDFEVRIKLLPLLARKVKVKRFIVKSPKIFLEKNSQGKGNWEGIGKTQDTSLPEPPDSSTPPSGQEPEQTDSAETAQSALVLPDFAIGEFSITDGLLNWKDQTTNTSKEIKEINLVLANVSTDKPIQVNFHATADNYPVALKGTVGPVGREPDKAPIAVNLTSTLINELIIVLTGQVKNALSSPNIQMSMKIEPFSLRNAFKTLKQPFPLETADDTVFNKLGLDAQLKGSADQISISNGNILLDSSKMTFSVLAKEFGKPNLTFNGELDAIDVDRYLPPPQTATDEKDKKPEPAPKEDTAQEPAKKNGYGPLLKLVMDAKFKAGQLKVKKANMRNVNIAVTAKDGMIRVNPAEMDLYEGALAATAQMDLRGDTPKSNINLDLKSVQSGPLVKDILEKNIIEGVLKAALDFEFEGAEPALIRQTLGGKGELNFNDGAIVGIDLADMVRNIRSSFSGQKTTEKPRTDFSELSVPFTASKGIINLDGATLNSPLLRITADGKTNLAEEKLAITVKPKFVATLVGQGDEKKRSGIMVPVIVGGTYEKPTFRPDLKALITDPSGIPGSENITKETQKAKKQVDEKKEKATEDIEEKAKDLFDKLPIAPKQ
ncbi:MAG: AsmA family protein [Desulfobacteraceae bacterium]|nr:AsmA family protein [Desulfobacteraceae bacterium]